MSLGVELTIFMAGLVPGDSWDARGTALETVDYGEVMGRLNGFLAKALGRVRPLFGGQITYSSGPWEDVDWTGFDVVGVDMYRDATNATTFADDVRALHSHGKPVVITEFGCCTFRGAEDLGGTGFLVVDWSVSPPELREGTRPRRASAGRLSRRDVDDLRERGGPRRVRLRLHRSPAAHTFRRPRSTTTTRPASPSSSASPTITLRRTRRRDTSSPSSPSTPSPGDTRRSPSRARCSAVTVGRRRPAAVAASCRPTSCF